MKLARFHNGGETRPAVIDDDAVVDVSDQVDDCSPKSF